MLKALIFDFDGTLLDTETPEFHAWQTIYQEHGTDLALTDWLEGVGTWYAFDPYLDLAQKLGRTVDRDAIKQRLRTLHDDVLLDTPPREGTLRLLDEARALSLKLGIASSSSHSWVEGHLARYGLLDRFDAIKCRDDVGSDRTKPQPDLYLAVLDALVITADEAIAFEDSLNGVKSAKAAGLYVIAVSNPITQHMQLGVADRLVETFEDVRLNELIQLRSTASHEVD